MACFKYPTVAVLVLMVAIGICTTPCGASEPTSKTLSPYFFIEGGQEGVDRLPLKTTSVDVTINAVIARVKVMQQYENTGTRPIHARYVFPASTRAAVHGMRMQVGEQVVVARIQERKKAEATFGQAKKEGKSASLLTEERPNVFTMQVANIMPGDTVRIELDYTELMVPTDGTYEFVYPTVVGPRYSTVPEAGAGTNSQWLKNPYLKADQPPTSTFDIQVHIAAGMPIEEMVCPSHQTDIAWHDASEASVALSPSDQNSGNRDYILRYRLAGRQIQSGLMLYKGETENFFLMMIQPPERIEPETVVDREYVFVVDVSGSMNGFPLDTAKTLLHDLAGTLRPGDRFNVILFAGAARVLSAQSLPADETNLKRAIDFIDRENGGGGTELAHALETALALPRTEGMARSVVVVTDGYIALEKEVFGLIGDHLGSTNFFTFGIGSSVNRHLIEGLALIGNGEPFVVTDPGQALEAAARFRQYIDAPVLTGIKIEYEDWQVYDVTPNHVPDLFAQRPLIISGKWRGEPGGRVRITGLAGDGPYDQSLALPHMEMPDTNDALPYLWARTRLAYLTDLNPDDQDADTREQVVSLGLAYNLLTPHTAFVAVDETVRNMGYDAEDVKQPSPMPKGVSNMAVGGRNVPEPGLVFMLALLGLAALSRWVRRKVIN